jgi:hypothetical protein
VDNKSIIKVIKGNWPDARYSILREALTSVIEMLEKPSFDEKINALKEIKDVQAQPGNLYSDNDNYMVGLYNGLELALSILTGEEPQYKPTRAIEETGGSKAAIEHETMVDCILSCFSNDDLNKHIELRRALEKQTAGETKDIYLEDIEDNGAELMNDCNKDTCSDCNDKCNNGLEEKYLTESDLNNYKHEIDKTVKSDTVYLEQDNGPQKENKSIYFGE